MSSSNVNPVDAAIAAANAKAEATPDQAPIEMTQLPATASGGSSVAAYVPVQAPSLDTLSQGSMNVDNWLKVKEFGLLVDNKTDLIEKIKVRIDFGANEVQPFTGIRFGNPVQYLKTYDGVACATGGTWNEAVRRANAVDPGARPYMGAGIQMSLLEDAKSAKGATVAEAGVRLGHSTSITNRNTLAEFIQEVKKAGLINQAVEAEIGFKKMTNSKGQSWGILTFTLLGASE